LEIEKKREMKLIKEKYNKKIMIVKTKLGTSFLTSTLSINKLSEEMNKNYLKCAKERREEGLGEDMKKDYSSTGTTEPGLLEMSAECL
jgi:hypothetical protein